MAEKKKVIITTLLHFLDPIHFQPDCIYSRSGPTCLMRKLIPCFISVLFLVPALGQAQTKFPSLPSQVLSNYEPKTPKEVTPELMAKRAQRFLAGLSDDLRIARVYLRLLTTEPSDREKTALVRGMKRASGYLRRELTSRIQLKPSCPA